MKRTLCTLAVATALALAAPATQAHHAFGAEFRPEPTHPNQGPRP